MSCNCAVCTWNLSKTHRPRHDHVLSVTWKETQDNNKSANLTVAQILKNEKETTCLRNPKQFVRLTGVLQHLREAWLRAAKWLKVFFFFWVKPFNTSVLIPGNDTKRCPGKHLNFLGFLRKEKKPSKPACHASSWWGNSNYYIECIQKAFTAFCCYSNNIK